MLGGGVTFGGNDILGGMLLKVYGLKNALSSKKSSPFCILYKAWVNNMITSYINEYPPFIRNDSYYRFFFNVKYNIDIVTKII